MTLHVALALSALAASVLLLLFSQQRALAIPGLIAWFRATAKGAVSAAALVAFTGALQVLVYVGARL